MTRWRRSPRELSANSPTGLAGFLDLRDELIGAVYEAGERRVGVGYPPAMPLYEYESIEDGEVIELLRPMKDADRPVEDPAGRGRTFRRRMSVFGVSGAAEAASSPASGGHVHSAGCGCGKPRGSCGLG
jgi:hypothetical protein